MIVFDMSLMATGHPGFLRVASLAIRLSTRVSCPVIAYVREPSALLESRGALQVVGVDGSPLARSLTRAARLTADRPALYLGVGRIPARIECRTMLLIVDHARETDVARADEALALGAPSDDDVVLARIDGAWRELTCHLPVRERVSRTDIPLVTAVVVAHGEPERLRPCLDAILAQGMGERVRMVVVCNLRGDGCADLVRAEYPEASVLDQPTQRGFAYNQNSGFAAHPGEFGMALNPDVRLAPGCLEGLVAFMREHRSCGIAAPEVRYPDGSWQKSARRFPEMAGTLARRTPIRLLVSPSRLFPSHYLPPPGASRPVDWALGGCLFVRREAWEDLGGFDAAYRLYVEDIDIAWRAWQRGWEIWQTTSATAIHEYQQVIDRSFITRRTLWHLRGMGRFVRKHPAVLLGLRPSLAEAAQAISR